MIKKYQKPESVNSLKFFHAEEPRGRFIAIYCDGSGCELFMKLEIGGYLDAEGEERDNLEESMFFYWVPLPDDFKFWFETDGQE